MKAKSQLIVAVLLMALGVLTLPVAVHSEAKDEKQTASLNELLKQRRDTLRQLVDVVTVEYREGITGFESVVRASDQLLNAELDLASNPKARIAVLQRRVEVMKDLFSMVDTKFKGGQVSTAQLLTARATLLEAQISLARERGNVTGRDEE